MVNWKEKTLGEVTSFITKGIPPKYSDYESESTIWVLNQKCNRNFEISYADARLHDYNFKKVPENKMLMNGDVLINSTGTGTAGRVAQLQNIKKPTTIDGHMILLRPTDDIDSLYYGYAIKSCQSQIEGLAEGSTGQTELNRKRLQDEVIIRYPVDKQEQKAIAYLLSDLDEKIKINVKINNNLLQQVITLYDELVKSHDWPVVTILDIAEKVAMGPFGSNIKVSTFVPKGVPIISGNHLRGYFLEEPEFNYITEEHAEHLKNSIVYTHDIVFTHAGNIGQVAIIPDGCKYKHYVLSQRQFYLRCNEAKVVPEFVLLFFHSASGQHELLSYANQTGVPSIAQPATNLKKILFKCPPIEMQLEWKVQVSPMIERYLNNRYENESLYSLRDYLLPKLMSGEIDVSNIDI